MAAARGELLIPTIVLLRPHPGPRWSCGGAGEAGPHGTSMRCSRHVHSCAISLSLVDRCASPSTSETMTVVTGEGTTAVRDRWSAGGWLAAVCVFLLLAAGIPGRAVAATPAGTAPGLGAVRLVEEGNHVTIELDLTGDLKADLLRDWVEQIDRSHPLLSDTIKETCRPTDSNPRSRSATTATGWTSTAPCR